MLLSLALRTLRRRPARTCTTLLGVALGVATLFSVLALHRGYQEGMRSELDRLGAHILVVPKGCPYDAASMALHGASWPCYLRAGYLSEVQATPGVAVAAPLLMNAVTVPGGGQAVYIGARPDLLALRRGWHIQGRFPQAESGKGLEVLVGSEVAREHGLALGQSFALPGLEAKATVAGVLERTGGADDLFVHMPLGAAQRLFYRPGQLTHILVRLRDPDQLEGVTSALRGCDAGLQMNVVPLSHLFQSIQQLLRSTRLLLLCVALVALLAAGAGVGNAVLLSVTERTREIGVLRALGASVSEVVRLIWLEALAICAGGAALGLTLALLGGGWIEAWLRARLPFAPSDALMRGDAAAAAGCALVALLLGSAAALPAAWRAGQLPPVAAMRAGSA
jgi:putative ABC transport system permease protein